MYVDLCKTHTLTHYSQIRHNLTHLYGLLKYLLSRVHHTSNFLMDFVLMVYQQQIMQPTCNLHGTQ